VKRGLIGLLGGALFIAGCVLFMMASQTATLGYVFLGQAPGRGTGYRIAGPDDPTYPLAQQMGRLWPPEALVYVNLYLAMLAVCVGVTLALISFRGLGTRDDTNQSRLGGAGWTALGTSFVVWVLLTNAPAVTAPFPPWDPVRYVFTLLSTPQTGLGLLSMSLLLTLVGITLESRSGRAGWVALLVAWVVGVVLANLSGWAYPPPDPCFFSPSCPAWNPGPFGPPIWTLLHTYPLVVLAVLAMSVLLSLVGFFLAWRMRGGLTPVVVRGLQLAPLLVVTLIGLAALFLFPLPYSL
jgi:hypothetical protein